LNDPQIRELTPSLLQRRNDFRILADAMPQLVWTARPDGTIEYFNERWLAYTGLTVEATQREGVKGVVHPDELHETWARWNASLQKCQPYEIEYRLRNAKDGSYRWFLGRAIPILTENGELSGWIGTATDIEEQRRAQESVEFIAEAGNLLAAVLDTRTICEKFAQLAIRHFADWCFVTLMEDQHRFPTVAIAHKNAELVRYLEQFRDKYPVRPGTPLAQMMADKKPVLLERILPEQIEAGAEDAEHLRLLKLLCMHSVMMVPLCTPEGDVYGGVTLVSAESGRLFNKTDLSIADSVARRAAIAIRNAKILAEEKRTSRRLRFSSKASQMLFESLDLKQTLAGVAKLIVSELVDLCMIAKIDGDALRVEAIAHSDPAMQPLIDRLRGQRLLRRQAERNLIESLKTNRPQMQRNVDQTQLLSAVWPYTAADVAALNIKSSIAVPLHSGPTTYGALLAYYTTARRSYNEEDLPLLIEIANRVSITMANAEALERERRIAATFQQASLPSLIPQPQGVHFNAVYSPAGEEGEIGGDWYDAIELDDGSLVISVGDVSGQGLSAAVIMSKVRHAMAVVPLHEREPARILDSADWVLRKRYPNALVTAFVGVISADRKTLRYANAGHPYPLLRRDGEVTELKSFGLPLGLRPFDVAGSEEIAIKEGDMLVLYTDGLTEWGRDWSAGETRLREVVLTEAMIHSHEPARLIESACIPRQSHDDVAILTVTFGEPPRWWLKAEDPRAAEHARSEFVDYLRQHATDDTLIAASELVFGELLSNVVRHAPGCPVEVQVDWSADRPSVHVIDCGPAFDMRRSLPDDLLSEYGRGLFIVQQICDDLQVERVPGYGNHVSVTLPVSRNDGSL
jgi:PAS domain S-box-containing protein